MHRRVSTPIILLSHHLANSKFRLPTIRNVKEQTYFAWSVRCNGSDLDGFSQSSGVGVEGNDGVSLFEKVLGHAAAHVAEADESYGRWR